MLAGPPARLRFAPRLGSLWGSREAFGLPLTLYVDRMLNEVLRPRLPQYQHVVWDVSPKRLERELLRPGQARWWMRRCGT